MIRLLFALVLVIGLAGCGGASSQSEGDPESATPVADAPSPKSPSPAQTLASESTTPGLTEAQVTEVVDGDTLKVSIDGQPQTVRIIGVDTPETKDPRQPVMCYGAEAMAKTRELIDQADGRVLLEKDVSETDRYDRLLRYVWLEHPDGRRMLNKELVKGGYAQASTYPPDVKYQDMFLAAAREAREQGRGRGASVAVSACRLRRRKSWN